MARSTEHRYALGLEYRGTHYFGWEYQKDLPSIEGCLERALKKMSHRNYDYGLTAAGRTDAGVHACLQIVHLDLPFLISEPALVKALNDHLPQDIRLVWCRAMYASFNARFSCRARRYRYVFYTGTAQNAFLADFVCFIKNSPNVSAMREQANYLLGTQDFSAFRYASCQAKSPIRTIRELSIETKGNFTWIDLEASGFLHNMVRIIAGTLLQYGTKQESLQNLGDILFSRNRKNAGPTLGPQGLYFLGARYDPLYNLPEIKEPCFLAPFSKI